MIIKTYFQRVKMSNPRNKGLLGAVKAVKLSGGGKDGSDYHPAKKRQSIKDSKIELFFFVLVQFFSCRASLGMHFILGNFHPRQFSFQISFAFSSLSYSVSAIAIWLQMKHKKMPSMPKLPMLAIQGKLQQIYGLHRKCTNFTRKLNSHCSLFRIV